MAFEDGSDGQTHCMPQVLEKPGDMLEFWVAGKPIAQPRSSPGRGHHYTPDNGVKQWKDAIGLELCCAYDYYNAKLLTCPLRIDLCFYIERPANEIRKTLPNLPYLHTKLPDKDNLEKAVLDALQDVLYKNDSQVASGMTTKIRCGDGCWTPGVQIKVTVLDKYEIRKDGV